MYELKQGINRWKNNKQPGPDNILAEFLKYMEPKAMPTCLQLFSQIWKTFVPAEWKKTIIIPVLKSDKPLDTLFNYHPISLTSILSKIMERMVPVTVRLTYYLETQNILSPVQAGFRIHHTTI